MKEYTVANILDLLETVGDGLLSKTSQKKLSRHARLDTEIQAYSVSAFLIAQFRKNESARGNEHISGNQLMDRSFD